MMKIYSSWHPLPSSWSLLNVATHLVSSPSLHILTHSYLYYLPPPILFHQPLIPLPSPALPFTQPVTSLPSLPLILSRPLLTPFHRHHHQPITIPLPSPMSLSRTPPVFLTPTPRITPQRRHSRDIKDKSYLRRNVRVLDYHDEATAGAIRVPRSTSCKVRGHARIAPPPPPPPSPSPSGGSSRAKITRTNTLQTTQSLLLVRVRV